MATRIVGVGVKGTVAGNVVTFDRGISGDGLTAWAVDDFLLNLTTSTNSQITAIAKDAADRNKITSVTVTSAAGWSTGEFFGLTKDNTTTTFATIIAALSGISANSEIVVYPRAANGHRFASTLAIVVAVDNITVETDTIGTKNKLNYTGAFATPPFQLNNPATVRDFILFTSNNTNWGFFVSTPSNVGTTKFERCWSIGVGGRSGGSAFVGQGSATQDSVFNDCIAWGIQGVGFGHSITVTDQIRWNNCAAIFCTTGYKRVGGTETAKATNSLSFQCTTNFGATVTGDFNAASDTSAPGASSVDNITIANSKFAHNFSPNGASEFPFDWRPRNLSGTVLLAGTPIAENTLDYDGYAFDGTTPMIGPSSKNWPGFDPAAAPDPPKPDGVVVSDPTTDGDLTVTWSNSGSYLSGDVMMAHDKDDSNAILGGGDATTGTMRISNLTNNQQKNILLRAVRP